MSFPLRYQFAVVLVGLNVVGTAGLALFAYRASRNSLEAQATRAVGMVAQARQEALVDLLQRQRERMDAFLRSVESLCGESAGKGTLGWERGCARMALSGFQTAERATAATLAYRENDLATAGSWRAPADFTTSAELVTISGRVGQGNYTMHAARGLLALRVQRPLDDIERVFKDRSGLEANGEVFLTDGQGHFLTRPRYPIDPARPVLDTAVRPCLAGGAGQVVALDYHGGVVLTGFRPVPAVGGGCVVANLQYADVVLPIHRLGRLFVFASLAIILVGAVISLVVARAASKPIARLAASARALEAGKFGQPVPIAGPSEVRQLGRALSSMAQSVGSLVEREHQARLVAEGANRTKDDFLALVSHELRTPLNAILGWTSIMLNHPRDEATTVRALRAVERSAHTQARLIDELLDVSRIVTGQLQLSAASAVSLISIVETALETIRPAADAKRLDVVAQLPARSPIVAGDPGRLQQVVGNLVSNAVRFTPEGGRIDVSVASVADAAEIRVADSGIGIPPEFLPHVFERFRQAETGPTRSHSGLGLGLDIVRHLVELHGGTVQAESAGPGCGATFIVRLPQSAMIATPARQAESVITRPVPALLRGTRVLVVDDDRETRDVLREILEGAGASVIAMASAAETRAFLGSAGADLLIADLGMPAEDGYALIRSVRALETDDTAHVPAIALTAHTRPEDVQRALASGYQMHVSKPVDSLRLLTAVTKTLVRTWSN
jgi:signal transduction histidine kinase/ActR/RegA family two-component response regulator